VTVARSSADPRRPEQPAVGQRHLDLHGRLDDMVIRQHVPLAVHDESGAQSPRRYRLVELVSLDLACGDADHGRQHPGDHGRHTNLTVRV
jgi:hypothetical protein